MSFRYSSEISVPVTRTKPPKNFFSMFLTVVKLGRWATLPERDEQYHQVKSFTRTFDGAGHLGYRHSLVELVLFDMKLYKDHQRVIVSNATDIDHSRCPQFQGSFLISQVSLCERISVLLNFIFFIMGAILNTEKLLSDHGLNVKEYSNFSGF